MNILFCIGIDCVFNLSCPLTHQLSLVSAISISYTGCLILLALICSTCQLSMISQNDPCWGCDFCLYTPQGGRAIMWPFELFCPLCPPLDFFMLFVTH